MKKVNKYLASLLASFCMFATVTPVLAEGETDSTTTTEATESAETTETTTEDFATQEESFENESTEEAKESTSETSNESTDSSSESATTYTISIEDNHKDLITLSKTTAAKDEKVTFTLSSVENKSVTARLYSEDLKFSYSYELEGTGYSFKMPANNVVIEVVVYNDFSKFDMTKLNAAFEAEESVYQKVDDKYGTYDEWPDKLKDASAALGDAYLQTIVVAEEADVLTQAMLDEAADKYLAAVKEFEKIVDEVLGIGTTETSSKTPKTSDNSSVLFYGATLLITLVAGVGFVFFRKNRA